MDKALILKEIKKHYNFVSDADFARFLEIKPQTLSNWYARNTFDYDVLYTKCVEINIDWIFTGKGDMLKEENQPIAEKKEVKEIETRPRIPYDAAAGSLSVAIDGITIDHCEQLPIIKAFSKYDFTILAKGDSMLPEFHSGDELACLYVRPMSFIQWGRFHVLDTSQGVIVKRIFDDDEYILCKSENNELYKDFRILKSDVYNLALVIGLVRRY